MKVLSANHKHPKKGGAFAVFDTHILKAIFNHLLFFPMIESILSQSCPINSRVLEL